MPEGDSLHRLAAQLQPLVGDRVEASSPSPRGQATGVARAVDGRVLESVEAVGKHLLLRFEGGVVVRSHLRMNGRWRVRRLATSGWRGSPWLVLRTSAFEATQWNGPDLRLDDGRASRVGPDLLADDTRPEDAGRASQGRRPTAGARRRPRRPAGRIGNRQHVARRAALAGAGVAVASARKGDRRRARRRARLGTARDAGSGGRDAIASIRLPADGATVSSLQLADQVTRAGGCESHRVLVRHLPAWQLNGRRAGIGLSAQ